MQINLSKSEQQLFENLATSADGKALYEFIKRTIQIIESVRTKTELSTEARIEIADFLDQNFIQRIDRTQEQYIAPDAEEHE